VSAQKRKSRGPRVCLTHFEVRRGTVLLLRLAIADDAVGEVGDELGALLKKIAPGTTTQTIVPSLGAIAVVTPEASPSEFVVSPTHEGNDDEYHASLRARLAELFGSLCDASLADALAIAREERARRVDGGN